MHSINYWLYISLYIIYIITILSAVIVVISENRNPVKSIAWIVVLLFLPIIGIIFYFFFGQDYTKHRMISRKGNRKLQKNAIIAESPTNELHFQAESKQQIQLAYSLSQAALYNGNEVEVFTSGAKKFEALKTELLKASSYIHLQYYIFDNDRLGNEIKEILIAKARTGVIVRVIYDDVGCWKVKSKFFNEMISAGIEVHPFYKVTFPFLANKINYRNHRKIVIIDGHVGFIGGMNIADRYQDGLEWGEWRDTHALIRGSGVHGLQTSFSVDWFFTCKQLLSDPFYFPPVSNQGNISMQIVTSGPIGEWSKISLVLLKAIANAKQYIYIQTPYFLPTESLLKVLQVAALAKVDVRLMLPEKSDSAILHLATCSYITQMLKAGVKVYFYKGGFLHAKTIVIDHEFSTIGSTNLDFRSFEHNFEVNAFLYSSDLTDKMKNIFLFDQRKCRRITLRSWKQRPIISKVKESVIRLMSPLL